MRTIIYALLMLLCVTTASAQRKTDVLDRGLVAVKTANAVFCSWRILAEEYYDVKYNIYRNGTKLNSEPLNVSNYTDGSGTASSTYTVRAVVKGVEQADSKVATVWATGRVAKSSSQPAEQPNYLSIQMQDVVDRNGNIVFCSCGNHTPAASVAQNYTLNDCSVADLDGDGEMEILVKRLNASDASSTDTYAHNGEIYSTANTRAFVIIEAYKLNGQRLWWIDCGPNMVSLNSTELNVVAYDWDEDGKAEVLMRGADNMIVHKADGTTYTIGNGNVNTRKFMNSHSNSQYAWTRLGSEYLLYFEGATGALYNKVDFPLKRLETSEFSTSINWETVTQTQVNSYLSALNTAWGDNYGHRSSKYFFGAPVLDGRKASIFLARGIYTRTKMIALDVNPSTHEFTTKWTWSNNTKNSVWYGQGNHNMNIADVDGDGCDEIVYGSMVIDNNGKGLSSTGLGHGDAMHTSDLDPFRKGMETFACNEDNAGNNYRNATTCEIYYRNTAANDDGRAMAGNFSNDYPGSIAASLSSPVISLTTATGIDGLANECFQKPWNPMSLNGIIYWDGDLCAETFDSPGTEGEGTVSKLGTRIMQSSGCKLNNDSKNNPCFQGDILGDWREELVLRASDNNSLRILTTTYPTSYRIPSLWFDPEYRQAMVWQMCAYNQPPHPSFFIGEMEGITAAPPALTNTGKTEIAVNSSANATINNSINGQDLLIVVEPSKSYNKRYAITLDGSVAPASLTVNAPVIVSGNNDNNNITSTAYSCLISYTNNGTFSGSMRLIKQGEGALTLPNKTMTHSGQTDIWEGSVTNDKGTISNSKVWMNRHTTLNTTSGSFKGGIEMNYNSTFYVGTSTTVSNLIMNYGSRVVFDHVASTSDAAQNTQVNITGALTIDKKDWQYGPEYLVPVFQIKSASALAIGKYPIGTIANVTGELSDIIIEGNFANGTKQTLLNESGTLVLSVYDEHGDPDDDVVVATLVHTGSTTCGSDNTVVTYSCDAEKEHYNNEGSGTWQGYAFAQFNFTIPQGKRIKSATLTCSYYSSKGYGSSLYYLKAGQSVNFDAISAGTAGLLRKNGAKTFIANIAGYTGLQSDVETDVTEAVTAMQSAGTIYFQWTANGGGADIYGKASASAPTLDIVLEDIPASDDTPVDVTGYISDAKFEGLEVNGNNYGGWSFTKNGGNGPMYPFGASSSTRCEFWDNPATALSFSVTQTLENLPAGTYKLTAMAANSLNGETSNNENGCAVLFANTTGSAVGTGNTFGCPSTAVEVKSGDAVENLTEYSVIFTINEAKDVTIGFKSFGTMEARWFLCDDFTLTYYGTESEKEQTGEVVLTIVPETTVWDFSEYTTQVTLNSDLNSTYSTEYTKNGMTLTIVGKTDGTETSEYVSDKAGFHCNGTSSPSTRYIKFTPSVSGSLTVNFKSNNSKDNSRTTAIGTAVGTPIVLDDCNRGIVSAYLTAGTTYYVYFASGGQSITKLTFEPAKTVTLSEAKDYSEFKTGTYDVTLKKTFTSGWTTLVLPFSATTEQLMEAFPNKAANTEVAVIKEMKNNTIYFITQAHIDANTPVLVNVGDVSADNTYTFKGVTVVNNATPNTQMKDGIQMKGLYKKTNYDQDPINSDKEHVYFVYQDKFYDWSYLSYIPPFSAYIYTQDAYSAAKPLNFMINGVITGIINADGTVETTDDSPEYNIVGQRVSKSVKGLHIKNGKKYLVK